MRRAKILPAIGVAAVLAAGCGSGSSSVPAAPTKPVDVSKLDVAGYNIDLAPLGKQNLERARVSEAQRLASYLPLMMDIDPRYKYQEGTKPEAVFGFTDDAADTDLATQNLTADAPGFVAGFSVDGCTDPHVTISACAYYSVLIFKDDASATAGSKSLATMQFAHQNTNQPIDIPGRSSTQAFWRPDEDTMESFTASNRYVIYTHATDFALKEINSPDLGALTALTGKIIEAAPLALENFKPTPVDQLTNMEFDQDGMLSRSVTKTTGDIGRSPAGIYNQHGALLLSNVIGQVEAGSHGLPAANWTRVSNASRPCLAAVEM